MRLILRLTAAVCLFAGLGADRASAAILYKLGSDADSEFAYFENKATGASWGEMSGWFLTNDDRSELLAAEILVSAFVGGSNSVFDEIVYEFKKGDPISDENKHLIKNDPLSPFTRLVLNTFNEDGEAITRLKLDFFPDGLQASGKTYLTDEGSSSQENQTKARNVVAGAWVMATPVAAPVPEPSALAMSLICAPALWLFVRRRRGAARDA